ncbi:hypothetical protein Tfu_0208 [Thermobifida fusca YX]|uniref:Uncharacterized protein n=1 Tax=Thermobifida fusca (strain YX) TaxID=269800 RepID=Q47TG8_THEFY|nr:hypothetical protein Tfu_0208 [Thermobifida fusca YX]
MRSPSESPKKRDAFGRHQNARNGAAALFPTRVVKPAPGNQQTTIRDCKNINEIFLGLVAVLEDARHGHIHAFRDDPAHPVPARPAGPGRQRDSPFPAADGRHPGKPHVNVFVQQRSTSVLVTAVQIEVEEPCMLDSDHGDASAG